jgi:hypothetical protein
VARLFALNAEGYERHVLHGQERDWPESNCYIDIWIEVLNALALDVYACLPFTIATDFEGDQWTFFKPPLADIQALYGIRVEELTLWRPLTEHCRTQIGRQSLPIVEVDAYYLPDTRGTDYRQNHVKTSIAITRLAGERLCYFHNASFFELAGEDYRGIFGIDPKPGKGWLPPYAEIAKLPDAVALPEAELRRTSLALLEKHWLGRPKKNPFEAYSEALPEHLELLLQEGEETYHAYSFASLRQLGAAFELGGRYLAWLGRTESDFAPASQPLLDISTSAKTLMLKAARIARSKRPKDLGPDVEQMAERHQAAMDVLSRCFSDKPLLAREPMPARKPA